MKEKCELAHFPGLNCHGLGSLAATVTLNPEQQKEGRRWGEGESGGGGRQGRGKRSSLTDFVVVGVWGLAGGGLEVQSQLLFVEGIGAIP